MQKTENKTPFTFQFLKQQNCFWKSRCEASKKIKSYYSKHFYLWRSFLHGQGTAMSGVTGLHDSENNDDFNGLGCSLPWPVIWRTGFFWAWSSSGRDQSFHCLQKHFWFVIQDWRQRHKSCEYPQKFHRCWKWTRVYLPAADPPQPILISTSTPCFHFLLKASLKVSLNRY